MNISVLIAEAMLSFLIADLGATRFRTREAAHRQLQALGDLTAPLLARNLAHPEPEVRTRCCKLLAEVGQCWAWRTAGTLFHGRATRHPWVCFGNYESEQSEHWLLAAWERLHPAVPWETWDGGGWDDSWQGYRVATRLWLAGRLLAGHDPELLRFDLAVMADAEAVWWLQQIWWRLRHLLLERM
jgi:hypothetical protein